MRGYIRADDIDYVKTLILNGKYFDEFEIRVKPNAKIEIFEAIWNKKYHLPLRGHLIVNATYFGNGGKYYGEYAPVDDGFGNNTAVDRKGKITDIEMALRGELSKNIPFSKIFDNMIYLDNRRFFGHFCNKYFLVSEDGYIVEGNNLFFDEVDEFGDYDISRVKRNDKGYSFIDRNGELINNGNMWFEMARQVHDNCAVIYVAGKGYSFINSQGVLCNKWFQDFEDFSCGFACVKRDDFKWSFIDLHGNLLKNGSMWFDKVEDFDDDGFAMVEIDEEPYIIDTNGDFYNYWSMKRISNPMANIHEKCQRKDNFINETIHKVIHGYLLYK